jgi:glyoxylase-like metal-dependent hydrolase (beta-lactamase superfamily II)/rhodanese-related sulfurtransferase
MLGGGMIFKQFFDPSSSTYSYLLAAQQGSDAIIIDAVLEHVQAYLDFLEQQQLKLTKVVDTHTHADHVTGMGELRKATGCITLASQWSQAQKVSVRFDDGELIQVSGISLQVIHTPGHTDESCCFFEKDLNLLFTGDTLLIRGCGRTDFQAGDAGDLYDSITRRLFILPDTTLVYPGHDYKGEAFSTIGRERRMNPRVAGKSREEFIRLMNNLQLATPKMMDIAVPLNMSLGSDLNDEIAQRAIVVSEDIDKYTQDSNCLIIDLREKSEIERSGTLAGSVNIPYHAIESAIAPGGFVNQIIASGRNVLFVCAHGERSALALRKLESEDLESCYHLKDGIESLKAQGYPLTTQIVRAKQN